MSQIKGRLIKPPTVFIDHVVFDVETDPSGKPARGSLELTVGAALEAGETYRVELEDGRSGTVRVTGYNSVSTKGLFEVVDGLS